MQSSSYPAILLWPFLFQQWRSWTQCSQKPSLHSAAACQNTWQSHWVATWQPGSSRWTQATPIVWEMPPHSIWTGFFPSWGRANTKPNILSETLAGLDKWMFPPGLIMLKRVCSTDIQLCWSFPLPCQGEMSSSMVRELHPPITQQGSVCLQGGCTNNTHSWPDLAAAGGQEESRRKKVVRRNTGSKEGKLNLCIWLSMVEKPIFWSYWGCAERNSWKPVFTVRLP